MKGNMSKKEDILNKESSAIINRIHNVSVVGVATAVSNKWESIEEAANKYRLDDSFNIKKYIKTTGVKGRWIASDQQTSSDFCFSAANALLDKYSIDREDVGIIVYLTQTPDYAFPATACVLHKRLGLSKRCIAFDVNQGCAGYVYGLSIVSALMETGDAKYALFLCGDARGTKMYGNKHTYKKIFPSMFLFGDSGTATLLKKEENANELCFLNKTDGEGFEAIIMPGERWRRPFFPNILLMDDITVFNFATKEPVDSINEYMKIMGTSPSYYDGLVPHQANLLILKQIAKYTKFPEEKLLMSIDTMGNMSSASIPDTLVAIFGDDNSRNMKRFLCCGFGIGLSWGVVELYLRPTDILPLVHTDEFFDDGYGDVSKHL